MHSETWLDKATRLQRELRGAQEEDEERAASERINLALWLRREFGELEPTSNVVPFPSLD